MGWFSRSVKKKIDEELFSEEKINIILCLKEARKFINKASYEAYHYSHPMRLPSTKLFGSSRSPIMGYHIIFPFADSLYWLKKALNSTELLVQKIREEKYSGYRGGSLSNNQISLLEKYSNLVSQIKNYYIPFVINMGQSPWGAYDKIKGKGDEYNRYKEVKVLIKQFDNEIKSLKAIR